MKKSSSFFSISILVLLICLLVVMFIGTFLLRYYEINWNKSKYKEGITYTVEWEKIYPHSQYANGEKKEQKSEQCSKKFLDTYYSKMLKLGSIDELLEPNLFKYEKITELGATINTFLSDSSKVGSNVKLTNDYWTIVEEKNTLKNYSTIIENIDELNKFLLNKNIPFEYILPPSKNCKYDSKLPMGVNDFTNYNMDLLLKGLDGKNISYTDLRKNIHEDYTNHYNLFYKTDHHWKIETGLWACNVIENSIEKKYGIIFEKKFNDRNFYINKKFKNALFGSAGHAVGHLILNSEDLVIPMPKFKTSFSVKIKDKKINNTGSFEELFVNYSVLNNEIKKGGGFAYETVMYGNRPLVHIKNNFNKEKPKVLIIRDSNAIAVSPYLALGCSELDLIDNRLQNGNFNGSIKTYINKTNPDIVLLLMSDFASSFE